MAWTRPRGRGRARAAAAGKPGLDRSFLETFGGGSELRMTGGFESDLASNFSEVSSLYDRSERSDRERSRLRLKNVPRNATNDAAEGSGGEESSGYGSDAPGLGRSRSSDESSSDSSSEDSSLMLPGDKRRHDIRKARRRQSHRKKKKKKKKKKKRAGIAAGIVVVGGINTNPDVGDDREAVAATTRYSSDYLQRERSYAKGTSRGGGRGKGSRGIGKGRTLPGPEFSSGMTAWDRHKKYVNDYISHFGSGGGGRAGLVSTIGGPGADKHAEAAARRAALVANYKSDADILRENYRFIRTGDDNDDSTYEKRQAKKYYDKLFREYCLADMSRWRTSQLGLRWRTQREVFAGKGQFVCGNKACAGRDELYSYEVNFRYAEAGSQKRALVKLRLCPECGYKLNFGHHDRIASEVRRARRKRDKRKRKGKRKRKRGDGEQSGDTLSAGAEEPTAKRRRGQDGTVVADGGDAAGITNAGGDSNSDSGNGSDDMIVVGGRTVDPATRNPTSEERAILERAYRRDALAKKMEERRRRHGIGGGSSGRSKREALTAAARALAETATADTSTVPSVAKKAVPKNDYGDGQAAAVASEIWAAKRPVVEADEESKADDMDDFFEGLFP